MIGITKNSLSMKIDMEPAIHGLLNGNICSQNDISFAYRRNTHRDKGERSEFLGQQNLRTCILTVLYNLDWMFLTKFTLLILKKGS